MVVVVLAELLVWLRVGGRADSDVLVLTVLLIVYQQGTCCCGTQRTGLVMMSVSWFGDNVVS